MDPRALPRLSLAAALLLAGCGGGVVATSSSSRPRTDHNAPPACPQLRERLLRRVADPALGELSGLTFGRAHPGVLYGEEDSGSPPVLTTLSPGGRVLGHVRVTGAVDVDWEDIAARRTRSRGAEIFVGDIGDNDAVRRSVTVYRVREPDSQAAATAPAAALNARYPDGAHDAEALLADPLRDELVIVTKSIVDANVYTLRASAPAGSMQRLRRGPAVALGLVTGGDVSADGRTIVLRGYGDLAVWRRRGREPLARTLGRTPDCRYPGLFAAERQGEAVAIAGDGPVLVTGSEGQRPRLRRFAPR